MNKSSIIKCLLSIAMVAYLIFALSYTSKVAASDTCNGLLINVVDSAKRGFVTTDDIDIELGGLSENILNISHDSIDTYKLEQQIMSRDNIERANCMILNDGSLRIDVVPLIPVARVFEKNGSNYYINRAGKRMKASTRYRMDVPIILGNFSDSLSPTKAYPLIDFLTDNQHFGNMTSAIEIMPNGDLILIPTIKGHVVNMGDTRDLKNKFDRLKVFYKKIMPVKGWEYYDTITVKWRGQIVAKRRHQKSAGPQILEEEHLDIDDEGTMLTVQNQASTI